MKSAIRRVQIPCRYGQPRDLGECIGCSDQRGCVDNLIKVWRARAKDAGLPLCTSYTNFLNDLAADPDYGNFGSENAHLVQMLRDRMEPLCGGESRPKEYYPIGSGLRGSARLARRVLWLLLAAVVLYLIVYSATTAAAAAAGGTK